MHFRKIFIVLTVLCVAFLLTGEANADISEDVVRQAWKEAAELAEIPELPLDIKDEKAPNAWVTSGQSVTVTTGLMKVLEREEEMFGILSHEAGHAKLKHHESGAQNALIVGGLALILGKALDSSLADVAVSIGAGLATRGFSREQEVEADDFAVDLAFKGGKDPTGLYTALERMVNYGGATQPSGFNSHPPDERRLKHIKDRILARDPKAVFPEVKKPDEDKK